MKLLRCRPGRLRAVCHGRGGCPDRRPDARPRSGHITKPIRHGRGGVEPQRGVVNFATARVASAETTQPGSLAIGAASAGSSLRARPHPFGAFPAASRRGAPALAEQADDPCRSGSTRQAISSSPPSSVARRKAAMKESPAPTVLTTDSAATIGQLTTRAPSARPSRSAQGCHCSACALGDRSADDPLGIVALLAQKNA